MSKNNVLGIIKKTAGKVGGHYDMSVEEAQAIAEYSPTVIEGMYNAFLYGYAQGRKAERVAARKPQA